MLKLVSILICVFVSAPVFAAPAAPTSCTGQSKYHVVTVEQVGPDIQATLENAQLRKYQDVSYPGEQYKIFGKDKATVLVKDVTIADYLKTRYLSRQVFVTMMYGRSDFVGEEDMFWAHADELFHSLVCK